MRLDRFHFIKTIHRNQKLENEEERKRAMFHGVLGYLTLCTNYKEAEIVIKKLFTLITNKFATATVTTATGDLIRLVKTHNIAESMENWHECMREDEDRYKQSKSQYEETDEEMFGEEESSDSYKATSTCSIRRNCKITS